MKSNLSAPPIAFITVEDNSSSEKLPLVLDELLNDASFDVSCLTQSIFYFIIKVDARDWGDISNISSSLAYFLAEFGVCSYTFNCSYGDEEC